MFYIFLLFMLLNLLSDLKSIHQLKVIDHTTFEYRLFVLWILEISAIDPGLAGKI